MANVNAYELREINMLAVIERANEKMYHLQKLVMSNADMLQMAKAQKHTANEQDLDMWESLSWHIVEVELIERMMREEDKNCESNSKLKPFNAGFNV
jgi:predicted phage tail protein